MKQENAFLVFYAKPNEIFMNLFNALTSTEKLSQTCVELSVQSEQVAR